MTESTQQPDLSKSAQEVDTFAAIRKAPLQAGLDNGELLAAWRKKLPGVEPTDRDLQAFAIGAEVGFDHAQDLERQDWNRVHHALKRAGVHPGRTDDLLSDVIERALLAAADRAKELEADARRYAWLKRQAVWRPGGGDCITWDVEMPEPDIRAGRLTETSVGEGLDAAIDRAQGEQHAG